MEADRVNAEGVHRDEAEPGVAAVVVGVDGSDTALRAVRWAVGVAARRRLPLRVVHAYGLVARYFAVEAPVPVGVIESILDDAQGIAADAAALAREVQPGLRVYTEVVDAPPSTALARSSDEAVMVVLGASGLGGITGRVAGATAVTAAAHATVPVVVVRCGEGRSEPRAEGPVVVGVDGSAAGERAIAAAFEEAESRATRLLAVHAWADVEDESVLRRARLFFTNTPAEEEQRALLAEQLASWQEKYPKVEVERVVVRGRPRRHLLDCSTEAQLLVVGSRGRGGFTGLLLGSTSQALIHHAQCPVMVVGPGCTES